MQASSLELDEVDFMSLLSRANQQRLLEGSTRGVYEACTVISYPAHLPQAYLIERGLVRGYTTVADGRQASIAFFHSGELLGATPIVSRPPPAFVQIVTTSTMVALDLERVRKLAAAENEVLSAVAVSLAARIRSAYKLIAIRTLGDIKQRLTFDLLERACRAQLAVGRLEVKATHADLADSIGSAREVVGRALASMREAGLVETGPGLVRVIDPLRLSGIMRAFAL